MHPVLRFLITAAALFAIAKYVPGFSIDGPWHALLAAIIFGLVNAVIGTVLRIIAFPITFLTIGLFSIVINWILFAIAVNWSPGFRATGYPWPWWESTLAGSVILSLVSAFVTTPLARSEKN
jgi:putative membrane protein